MEQLETKGLVIREVAVGEADKLLTLLTPDYGKLTVSVKGAASLKSRHMASSQLFAYSTFVLKKSKKYFYVSESETIECFFGIRFDLERLALATYICDVIDYLALEGVEDEGLLLLTLNPLYALSEKNNLSTAQIKASFELRAAAVSGFEPDLNECAACGKRDLSKGAIVDVMNGRVLCAECSGDPSFALNDYQSGTAVLRIKVSGPVLDAARFTVSSPLERFLSFSLPENDLPAFSSLCEKYLLSHIEHGFKSLDYYNDLIRYGYANE